MIKDIAVREIMSKNVITVNVDDRISKVEEIFQGHPIHHLVVLDGGKVAGVVSKSDLLKAHSQRIAQSSITVEAIMSKNPLMVEPEDTIGLVADIILVNKFHSLPVVEDGELAGIITSHDLLKYAYQ